MMLGLNPDDVEMLDRELMGIGEPSSGFSSSPSSGSASPPPSSRARPRASHTSSLCSSSSSAALKWRSAGADGIVAPLGLHGGTGTAAAAEAGAGARHAAAAGGAAPGRGRLGEPSHRAEDPAWQELFFEMEKAWAPVQQALQWYLPSGCAELTLAGGSTFDPGDASREAAEAAAVRSGEGGQRGGAPASGAEAAGEVGGEGREEAAKEGGHVELATTGNGGGGAASSASTSPGRSRRRSDKDDALSSTFDWLPAPPLLEDGASLRCEVSAQLAEQRELLLDLRRQTELLGERLSSVVGRGPESGSFSAAAPGPLADAAGSDDDGAAEAMLLLRRLAEEAEKEGEERRRLREALDSSAELQRGLRAALLRAEARAAEAAEEDRPSPSERRVEALFEELGRALRAEASEASAAAAAAAAAATMTSGFERALAAEREAHGAELTELAGQAGSLRRALEQQAQTLSAGLAALLLDRRRGGGASDARGASPELGGAGVEDIATERTWPPQQEKERLPPDQAASRRRRQRTPSPSSPTERRHEAFGGADGGGKVASPLLVRALHLSREGGRAAPRPPPPAAKAREGR